MRRQRLVRATAVLSVAALLATSCSGGGGDGEPGDVATAGADDSSVGLDVTGDGKVKIGVATPGPRDDGAYYQALVDAAYEISQSYGWEEPIVIDNVESVVAETELENLVAQGVDIVAVGAGELADPLGDLVQRHPEVFWYCNCGPGYPETPGVALSTDDGAEIQYVAGFAAGLLLEAGGGDGVTMIGCCGMDFEVETELAFRLGLKDVNPDFGLTYAPSGNFTGDFDNVAGAVEAFNAALNVGADALYPYLGGAHEPLVQLANDNDVIVMSAGASDVCERSDLRWDMAVLFDAGDFARAVFPDIVSGAMKEGSVRAFTVGKDPQVGAKICDPTPEQRDRLDEAQARIADGYCSEAFGIIKGIAYAGQEVAAPESCS